MSECLSRFQYHRRSKLDSLGVGGLGEFLVNELYPDLIDVETDVRLVLYGKVYEEVVPDRVYVFRRITIRCALVATFLILAGEFQIRLAKRVISAVDIDTAGLL